jgi:hypothetical protein
MPSNSTGRKILLSRLEGILGECVRNNKSWIRYPITWPDGSRIRGSRKILHAKVYTIDEMLEGRYIFGANELFVYRALNKILEELESMLPPGAMDELYDEIEEKES